MPNCLDNDDYTEALNEEKENDQLLKSFKKVRKSESLIIIKEKKVSTKSHRKNNDNDEAKI